MWQLGATVDHRLTKSGPRFEFFDTLQYIGVGRRGMG
jgi:hypothetical protein